MRVKYRSDGRLPPGEGDRFPAVQACSRLKGTGGAISTPAFNLLQILIGGYFYVQKCTKM